MQRRIRRARARRLARADKLERRARRLAAAAAAAALLPAAADAVTYFETGPGGLGDFGDSFAGRTVLPLDADVARGSSVLQDLCPPDGCYLAESDYFSFTGLAPGTAYSITLEDLFSDGGSVFWLYDDLQNQLFSGVAQYDDFTGDPGAIGFAGTIPVSGNLVVRALAGEDSAVYRVTLDAQLIPEPGTALLVGGGLAALGAGRLRARRTA